MNFGILTFWKTTNYGALLQALATQKVIREFGHKTKMIDYRQPAERHPWMLNWFELYFHRLGVGAVRFIFESRALSVAWRIARTRRYIWMFFGKGCSLSRCSAVVVGSDQLWNPRFLEEHGSFLLEDAPDKVSRISFATSIAVNALPVDLVGTFKQQLARFSAVSLREKSLIPFLSKLTGKEIYWSVDPVLMLSAAEWADVLKFRQRGVDNRSPIVAYCLSDVDIYIDRLIAVGRMEKRKVHLYCDLLSFKIHPGMHMRELCKYLKLRMKLLFCRQIAVCLSAGPREFVSDLASSYGVLTDSFHALMFSVVFQRNVKVLIPPDRRSMASRQTDFLGKVGFENVIVDDFHPDVLRNQSGTVLANRDVLNKWIAESKAWLKSALSCCGDR